MPSPSASPGVSVRLRHYITLATQSVPLIGLLGMIGRDFHAMQLLVLVPLAVTAAGPILELCGRPWGRYVTLGGFSLQITGMLLVIGVVLSMGSTQYIQWSDLALLTLFVPPVILLAWNWRAGRAPVPQPETQP